MQEKTNVHWRFNSKKKLIKTKNNEIKNKVINKQLAYDRLIIENEQIMNLRDNFTISHSPLSTVFNFLTTG